MYQFLQFFFIAQKIKVNYYDEFLKLHKYFKK